MHNLAKQVRWHRYLATAARMGANRAHVIVADWKIEALPDRFAQRSRRVDLLGIKIDVGMEVTNNGGVGHFVDIGTETLADEMGKWRRHA